MRKLVFQLNSELSDVRFTQGSRAWMPATGEGER